MTEKTKRVDYEMKYIGWNIGATRVERHETMGDIELLELTIDGVDVLKQLEKAEKWDYGQEIIGNDPKFFSRQVKRIQKLEAVKNWFNDWIDPWLDKAGEEGFMLPKKRMVSLKKILEAED